MEADVNKNDPVWRTHAVSWIVRRIDDLEYMVEMDRFHIDSEFKLVAAGQRGGPPRLLSENELNDKRIGSFVAKYESGGETSSWGDNTLDWIHSIPEWDDRRLRDEVETNEDDWQREHISFCGYDR